MSAVVPAQALPTDLFEILFTTATVIAGLMLLGLTLSLGVYAYRATRGEGVKDPKEVVPERIEDDEEGVREGDADDEWDYY